MALNLRKRLKDLLAGRSKGSSSNETLKTQLPPNLPPPLPPSLLGLLPNPNLQRKKRKERERSRRVRLPHQRTKNSRKKLQIEHKNPQQKAGRLSTWPMCTIQLGNPGQSWMAWCCPRTALSRNSREAMPITWLRFQSVPSYSPRTWMP